MSLNIDTDVVLLIDAENAFNSINRKVMLLNLKFICHIIATYIINCYATPSRLFTVSRGEILSIEGTAMRAMSSYESICIRFINLNKMNVVFADNFSVAGSLNSIKDYWVKLTAIGPKYGYLPKPGKSYLIVKEKNRWKRKT